jgi:hypothetical protein
MDITNTEQVRAVLALESRYFTLGDDLLNLRKNLKVQFGTDKVCELNTNQFAAYERDLPHVVEQQRYERWRRD